MWENQDAVKSKDIDCVLLHPAFIAKSLTAIRRDPSVTSHILSCNTPDV